MLNKIETNIILLNSTMLLKNKRYLNVTAARFVRNENRINTVVIFMNNDQVVEELVIDETEYLFDDKSSNKYTILNCFNAKEELQYKLRTNKIHDYEQRVLFLLNIIE